MEKIDLLITLTHKEDNANNVTLAFAMGAKALSKGHSVSIVLLSNAVHLAAKGYADAIDIGHPFPAIKDVLPAFMQGGGVLRVCKSCMIHNGVEEDTLLEGAVIIEADDVIDLLMNSEKTLQLN